MDASQSSSTLSPQLTQLTKFAFLLSSALPENSTSPVIGLNHHQELSHCFVPSGIVSCSSLSMHGSHSPNNNSNGDEESSSEMQERLASLNMNSRIYTGSDPNGISATPKTLLMNVIQSMRELMESRMSRTILQIMKTEAAAAGGGGNNSSSCRTMIYLLAPSRNAIKICTVVTRFEAAEDDDEEEDDLELSNSNSSQQQQLTTKLIFKAVLDIKIFGEVTTVEICGPVSFIGKFDTINKEKISANGQVSNSPLLSSVDIKFNCIALLREMMDKARLIVKKAVVEAANLSVKILSVAGSVGGATAAEEKVIANSENHAGMGNLLGGGTTTNIGGGNIGNNGLGLLSNDAMLAAAFNFGAGTQQQHGSTTTTTTNNNLSTDYSGMMLAALNNASRATATTAAAAGVSNAGSNTTEMLAAALKLGAARSSSQVSNSLTTGQEDGTRMANAAAASLKMGTLQSQGSAAAAAGINQPPIAAAAASQTAALAPASSLAQLSSLLQHSTSSNLLGAANNNNNALKSNHSFGSLFGSMGNLGSLRNDTFASLLKSSNSLNQLGVNADWGLHRGVGGGDKAADILRRHLNASSSVGANGGNANATFDFGTSNSNNNNVGSDAQARSLLLGLAGAGRGGSSAAAGGPNLINSLAARISSGSIEGVKNVVRFKDQTSDQVAATVAGITAQHQQPQVNSNALKDQMLEKLGTMLQQNQTTPQYNLLQDMLLLKTNETITMDQQTQSLAPASNQSPQNTAQKSKSPQETTGNIHKGLFSWLENDSMFLSEDKLKEQDLKHKKKERENQKAPMPLRFFSSADDGNLELMGQSIFGKKRKGEKSGGSDGQKKKKN